MQKIRLLITAFLVIFPIASFAENAIPENEPVYQKARQQLTELLEDPVTQFTFSKVQGNLLRTNLDLVTGNFFDSQPMFVAITPLFQEQMDKEVRAGIQEGDNKMTLLVRGSNYFHNDILDAAQAAIRASGKTEEEVQRARIFLSDGPMNAYTISGKNGDQVIVIDTGLIDKLTYLEQYRAANGQTLIRPRVKKDELQPVIEHENGHKLAGHIDIGLKLTAMIRILFNHFVAEPEKVDFDVEGDLSMLPDHHYEANASEFSTFYRAIHTKVVNFAERAITDVATQQEGAMDQIIQDFIEHLIRVVIKDGEMNEEVMTYLVSLRTAAPNTHAKDVFIKNIGQVVKLMGRGQETTADQYAHNGSRRAFIEAMFPKFNGAMEMTNPLDRDAYITELLDGNQAILDANFRLYSETSQEEREELLGTAGGDHPPPPARAENVRRYGRTLDSEAMQNPILRLVVLHGGLVNMTENAVKTIINIKKDMSNLQGLGSKISPTGKKILINLGKMLDVQTLIAGTAHVKAELVLSKLVNLIAEVGFAGNAYASNHALTDIMDFVLASKIRTLLTLNKISVKMRSVTKADEETLQKMSAEYQTQLFAGDAILKALRSAIHKGSQKSNIFTSKINQILDKNITVTKARTLRRGIAVALNEKDSWDRHWFYVEPNKEDRDIDGPSVKDDQEEMRKPLADRQRALNEINHRQPPLSDELPTSTLYLMPAPTLNPFLDGCRTKFKNIGQAVRKRLKIP